MKRAALAVVHGDTFRVAGGAPIELRVEDRLQSLAAPIRNASTAMLAVAAGSLLIHATLMALAVVAARAPLVIPQQHEIAVEVVQEAPKNQEAPKREEAAQQAVAKPQPPQAEQKTPAPPPPAKAPAPRQADPDAGKIKALQDELASLRAEQAALNAQSQDAEASSGESASGKALALPSIGADGDAIGYQQLVFSQLIKAKGNSEYHGQGGSTGVKFEIDDAGKLVRAEVTRSSGSAALDGRALDIVHRAAPFPPPPTAADRVVFANVNFVPPKSP